MSITAGTYVRGYLRRNDGNHIYFAGEVMLTYSTKIAGFDIPAVQVLCENGEIVYTLIGDVEPFEIRTDDPALMVDEIITFNEGMAQRAQMVMNFYGSEDARFDVAVQVFRDAKKAADEARWLQSAMSEGLI